LLEGKNVNLRVMEKEDVAFSTQWINEGIYGDYGPVMQLSRAQEERFFENPPPIEVAIQPAGFIIEKKDGTKIGMAGYLTVQPYKVTEIGFWLLPEEKGKGYGTEVVRLLVDYLFLSKEIGRVQATTHIENRASQKVLERVGFRREGTIRKLYFIKGLWADAILYSILREEWKEPKILTRT
jgi:ribosomal-protein-alanine N-acetyltransferase